MRRFLLPLLAIAVLAGCSSASNSTATPAKLQAAAATIAATVTTSRSPTPTPTPSPVSAPTLAPTPNDGLVHVQCSKAQATEALGKLTDVGGAFLDTYRVANQSSRISAPPLITQMQQQKRDMATMTFPPCAVAMRDAEVRDMNDIINIFIAALTDGTTQEDITALRGVEHASVTETLRLVTELREQADR
jgi:Prokaryotic membrane lipoprotein lipid attachment site